MEEPVPITKAVAYSERKERRTAGSMADGQSTIYGSQNSDRESGAGSVGSGGKSRLLRNRNKDNFKSK